MAGADIRNAWRAGPAAWLVCVALMAGTAHAAAPQPVFGSPDAAVAALVGALQAHDRGALAKLFGPGSEALLRSGDAVQDGHERQRFLDAYAARHELAPVDADHTFLHVGQNDWPLPIPIVQRDGRWHFDMADGAQQIIDRRIGRNELATISFCLIYVDAQKAYFDLFRQATGAGAYAQRLVSTPGNYDGVYWPAAENTPASPLASVAADAIAAGYPGERQAGKAVPYEGYFYRVLTAQGADAPGGRKSYLRDGRMTDGFALIAWPAIYRASGVMTFMVSQDGTVFQRDLGRSTTGRAAAILSFDPDLDWARIEIDGP